MNPKPTETSAPSPEGAETVYVTTPIYYVNDRPHIGHVYTTTVADVIARFHRLRGADVFFLTGTDEHATKVVDAAAERGLTAQQWADQNAAVFESTFKRLGMSHDDFIRTSQPRHTERVQRYFQALVDRGDVYEGDFEGWYDASQEEYVPEAKAKEWAYQSPVSGRPLVRRKEKNYFFRLSAYQDRLLDLLEKDQPELVRPEARRNEVTARIREGLNDVPISRAAEDGVRWGIPVPGDDAHTIYVWIDALWNYLSTVDTPERRRFWPATVHFIAKDILWFHAVIWPAVLMALNEATPRQVYAHSFWISEGRKMSKSLGNFIDLEKLDGYVETFGLDALRYFLAACGPLGVTDSDFAESRFIEAYNSDLANTLGNCASRVVNMTGRYFDGRLPEPGPGPEVDEDYATTAAEAVARVESAMAELQLGDAIGAALDLVRSVDGYIERTEPFRMAKDPDKLPVVGTVLYNCAEALRIAALLLWPTAPGKMTELLDRLGATEQSKVLRETGRGDLSTWARWGGLAPGAAVSKGDPLFPRYQG